MDTCAYDECGVLFTRKTHNQKYCTDEHCKLATNKRTMQKYYESKARKKGAVRICSTAGCSTLLSRYNESRICGKCESEFEAASRSRLLEMLSA